MKPADLDRWNARLLRVAWNVGGMALILLVFGSLLALQVRLQGFSTVPGSITGVLVIGLFFSPLIDRFLVRIERWHRSPWFDSTTGLIRASRRVVMAALGLAYLAYAYLTQSWGPLGDAAQHLLRALGL